MTDIRGQLQLALDNALYADKVYSYWNRKTETTGENASEYVVYTLSGDRADAHADNLPLVKVAGATVIYYYRDTLLETHIGRESVKQRQQSIESALLSVGFSIPFGAFDGGDIEDNGYATIIFECEYWRVV